MDFAALFDEYFGRIYAYANCRVRDAAAAEDIAAAVFGKAFERLAQYDPARGGPAQWLFGIARNEVNLHLRRGAILGFLPLDVFADIFRDKAAEAPAALEKKQAEGELAAALAGLSAQERDLISLKFYSEMNNREIAALTGLSESNVGTILYRCMAKLRRELTGEGK
ncbi:MAG TPA: sigma-70 family RNA polymerase sigma factor [Elusimicrobiales bacterium]|nr:sigma-70 family RNA polymerase sigma factor [Elusimicrobiales bacterium]